METIGNKTYKEYRMDKDMEMMYYNKVLGQWNSWVAQDLYELKEHEVRMLKKDIEIRDRVISELVERLENKEKEFMDYFNELEAIAFKLAGEKREREPEWNGSHLDLIDDAEKIYKKRPR